MAGTRISNTELTPAERIRQVLRVELTQSGGDPSQFLTSLASAIEMRAWEELGLPDLRAFVVSQQGLNARADDIETIASLHHRHEEADEATRERMDGLRRAVRDALNPELAKHGEIGGGHSRGRNHTSDRGRGESYDLRRLKRDFPELAEMVLAGEMSANAAAIEAGFKERRVSVPAGDPCRAAELLARHFDVPALIAALSRVSPEGLPSSDDG